MHYLIFSDKEFHVLQFREPDGKSTTAIVHTNWINEVDGDCWWPTNGKGRPLLNDSKYNDLLARGAIPGDDWVKYPKGSYKVLYSGNDLKKAKDKLRDSECREDLNSASEPGNELHVTIIKNKVTKSQRVVKTPSKYAGHQRSYESSPSPIQQNISLPAFPALPPGLDTRRVLDLERDIFEVEASTTLVGDGSTALLPSEFLDRLAEVIKDSITVSFRSIFQIFYENNRAIHNFHALLVKFLAPV